MEIPDYQDNPCIKLYCALDSELRAMIMTSTGIKVNIYNSLLYSFNKLFFINILKHKHIVSFLQFSQNVRENIGIALQLQATFRIIKQCVGVRVVEEVEGSFGINI